MKPDFASSYMYLGITLNRLNDFENSCSAFEKALSIEKYNLLRSVITSRDYVFELNYSIVLLSRSEEVKARSHFMAFEKAFQALDEESKKADPEILVMSQFSHSQTQRELLKKKLAIK